MCNYLNCWAVALFIKLTVVGILSISAEISIDNTNAPPSGQIPKALAF